MGTRRAKKGLGSVRRSRITSPKAIRRGGKKREGRGIKTREREIDLYQENRGGEIAPSIASRGTVLVSKKARGEFARKNERRRLGVSPQSERNKPKTKEKNTKVREESASLAAGKGENELYVASAWE